jgi:excisionase family DNA binding protein
MASAVTTKKCLIREVVGVMSGFEQIQSSASGSTVSVEEAARLLGIGRTLAYRLAAADELPVPVVRIGRKLRIPAAPLRALLGLRPDA